MAGINIVPMSTGLQADGSPDAALMQALAARKKAALTGGQQISRAASSPEPIYNKGLGYAKLLAGALGGWMEGQEARAATDKAKAGAASAAKLAQSWGMSPEQSAQLQGLMLTNPEQAGAIIKQMAEKAYGKSERTFGVIGKDIMGREQYGWVDPSDRSVVRASPGTNPVATPGPVQSAPLPPVAGTPGAPVASPQPGPAPQAGVPAPAPDPNFGRGQQGEDAQRRREMTAAGYPSHAPLPPPGVDPKTYFEEWSKSQTSRALPAGAQAVSQLRQEVQGLPSYKNFSQAMPIYRGMLDAAGRDNKAADLAIVYGIGKIMDPGSVVREGEMVMANDTQGWGDRLNGFIKSIQGGGRLTPETREALMREAFGRTQAYKQTFDQDMQQYRGIVERNGMNSADVIPDFGEVSPWERPQIQGPPIPADLPQQRAAAAAGVQPPEGGALPSLDDLNAEILRRQQQANPQQQPGSGLYLDGAGTY